MSKIHTKVLASFVHDLINNCSGSNKAEIISELQNKKTSESIKKYIDEFEIKAKKNKSEEDKEKPRRAKTSYLCFCEANRATVAAQNPDLNNKQLMEKLGEMWNSIKSTDDARQYVETADKDKMRYENEMKEFRDKFNIPDKEDKPKQPKKAIFLYKDDNYNDFLVANPELSKKDLNTLIQEKWKQHKTEKTDTYEKYTKLAEEEKKRFDGAVVEEEVLEEEEEDEVAAPPPKETKKEKKPKEVKEKKEVAKEPEKVEKKAEKKPKEVKETPKEVKEVKEKVVKPKKTKA
jgi:hypothetical protein